jgi:hypothetical protein
MNTIIPTKRLIIYSKFKNNIDRKLFLTKLSDYERKLYINDGAFYGINISGLEYHNWFGKKHFKKYMLKYLTVENTIFWDLKDFGGDNDGDFITMPANAIIHITDDSKFYTDVGMVFENE